MGWGLDKLNSVAGHFVMVNAATEEFKKKKKRLEVVDISKVEEYEEEEEEEDDDDDDEQVHQGAIILKQAFSKRAGGGTNGKKREPSPQDAAILIQKSFKAHLIRRSRILRALRQLADIKPAFNGVRTLFNNYSYRCRIDLDAVHPCEFEYMIYDLLIILHFIEGADLMLRAARRSMIDEMEAMVIDVSDKNINKKDVAALIDMGKKDLKLSAAAVTSVSVKANNDIAARVAKVVHK